MTHELYALSEDRSAATVLGFLDRFLPQRVPADVDYPIPESSDRPSLVIRVDLELLRYLEAHKAEPYGVYWDDAASTSFLQAMAFYTRDGKVILGLGGDFSDPAETLRELSGFVGAKYSRITDEERPPDTAAEFISLCRG